VFVKDSTTPKSRCYAATVGLPCDISFITVHVSGCCCFSDINISQGSVATHLGVVGYFIIAILQIYC